MMKKLLALGFTVLTLLCWKTASSYADPALILVPSVGIEERYNDNIFLTETDKEDDFITIVSPNIDLSYKPNSSVDLNLTYGFNFRFYADHNNLNDTSLRETQRANMRAQVRPFSRVFIDVSDFYRRVPVDVRDKSATDNDFQNMTDSNEFNVSPYVEIPVTSTMLARVGYRFRNMWYKDRNGNNIDSHTGFVSVTEQFPRGVSLTLGYDYSIYRPDVTDDYAAHYGYMRVDYQAASNLLVWAGAGRYYIDYKNASNDTSDSWDVGTEYRITELANTAVRVTYRSTITEGENWSSPDSGIQSAGTVGQEILANRNSITSGVTETERVDLTLTTGKYVDVSINSYYSDSKELETAREDEITGIDVNIQKSLTPSLTLMVNGLFEHQDFSPIDNTVRRYSGGTSFDYLVSRSIIASAGYRYNERDSEVSGDDYTNNIVWLQARMTF